MKELKLPSPENKELFDREIKILRNLDHVNIVRIKDWYSNYSLTVNQPWYTMEFLSGGTLRDLMAGSPRLGFTKDFIIEQILLPICRALESAHFAEIYHKDLRPGNLMFATSQTKMKIIDWGSLSHCQEDDWLGREQSRNSGPSFPGGSWDYNAPEQWFKGKVDGRTDIFSLGVIFYELMTGVCPTIYDIRGKTLDPVLPKRFNPKINPSTEQCLMKMIQANPDNRYQSASELIDVLESLPDRFSNEPSFSRPNPIETWAPRV